MQVVFMPTNPGARAYMLKTLKLFGFSYAEEDVVLAWRGRGYLLRGGTYIERADDCSMTIRTPEGMLVTYRPRRQA